jgi:hypothetical protein
MGDQWGPGCRFSKATPQRNLEKQYRNTFWMPEGPPDTSTAGGRALPRWVHDITAGKRLERLDPASVVTDAQLAQYERDGAVVTVASGGAAIATRLVYLFTAENHYGNMRINDFSTGG